MTGFFGGSGRVTPAVSILAIPRKKRDREIYYPSPNDAIRQRIHKKKSRTNHRDKRSFFLSMLVHAVLHPTQPFVSSPTTSLGKLHFFFFVCFSHTFFFNPSTQLTWCNVGFLLMAIRDDGGLDLSQDLKQGFQTFSAPFLFRRDDFYPVDFEKVLEVLKGDRR